MGATMPETDAAAPSSLKVVVEAIQTVTPARAADCREPRRVAVPGSIVREALAAHFRMVLFYDRVLDDRSGWAMAGQMKESLNMALPEQPVLAGRLWRRDDSDGFVIKFSDSGARLVQARVACSVSEFLGARGRGGESELAYWEDISFDIPQYSPLLYVQLTAFEGGRYSMGISCSLLAADPFQVTKFVNSWAQTHSKMLSHGRFAAASIFHLAQFRKAGGKPQKLEDHPSPNPGNSYKTTLLAVAGAEDPSSDGETHLMLPSPSCAEPLPLFVTGPSGEIRALALLTEEELSQKLGGRKAEEVDSELGGRAGACEIAFEEGEGGKPVRALCQLHSSVGRRWLAVFAPDYDGGGAGGWAWSSGTICAAVPRGTGQV